jgi:cysteinyl-tRNA synthetase
MSLGHLGMGFDIHGGGQDLIFPHHENEIAQSEAYTGTEPFVKYWLHNGFVTIKAEKMAKSVGNVTLVHEIAGWDRYSQRPVDLLNDLRMFFLSTHYRSPIDFSSEHLAEASRKVGGLTDLLFRIDYELNNADFSREGNADGDEVAFEQKIGGTTDKFKQAMDDDFNTPAAIGALFELERDVNKFIAKHQFGYAGSAKALLEGARDQIVELGERVLGFRLMDALPAEEGKGAEATSSSVGIIGAGQEADGERLRALASDCIGDQVNGSLTGAELVQLLIECREKARKEKDFAAADKIRAGLTEIGIIIEDTPHGARWKWK